VCCSSAADRPQDSLQTVTEPPSPMRLLNTSLAAAGHGRGVSRYRALLSDVPTLLEAVPRGPIDSVVTTGMMEGIAMTPNRVWERWLLAVLEMVHSRYRQRSTSFFQECLPRPLPSWQKPDDAHGSSIVGCASLAEVRRSAGQQCAGRRGQGVTIVGEACEQRGEHATHSRYSARRIVSSASLARFSRRGSFHTARPRFPAFEVTLGPRRSSAGIDRGP
jgi:hypothetical protein